MKSLTLIYICFLVVLQPAFSQSDELNDPSEFEKLSGYLRQVSIKKKLPTPKRVYAVNRPLSVHGKVKHVIDDYYDLIDEKDSIGIKIQANCTEYWFDKSRKLIKAKFYQNNPVELNYIYSQSQQLKKVIATYQDGKIDSLAFIYDLNELVRDRRRYSKGRIQQRTVVNYDSLSRPIEEYEINPYGPRVFTLRYFYTGASSNLDSIKPELGDRHEFYYENGHLIREDFLDPLNSRLSFRIIYNSKEEIVQEYFHDPSASTIYRYQYDKRGNWIKRITIRKSKPDCYTRRKVEYY